MCRNCNHFHFQFRVVPDAKILTAIYLQGIFWQIPKYKKNNLIFEQAHLFSKKTGLFQNLI